MKRRKLSAFSNFVGATRYLVGAEAIIAAAQGPGVPTWNQYKLEELAEGRHVPRDDELEGFITAKDRRWAREKIAARIKAGTHYWAELP